MVSEDLAVDFPYTAGYSCVGTIDDEGLLIVDSTAQGIVLKSPECEVIPGLYEVTAIYEITETDKDRLDAKLEIACENGNSVLISEKMPSDQTSVTVSNVNILSDFQLNVQIRKNGDGEIRIHKLIFERVSEPIS